MLFFPVHHHIWHSRAILKTRSTLPPKVRYIQPQFEISVMCMDLNWYSELNRSPPKHCYWLLVACMARTCPHCIHGNQYCGEGTAEVWAVLARWGDQGVWSVQSHPWRPAGVCRLHHQAAICLCEFDELGNVMLEDEFTRTPFWLIYTPSYAF